MGHGIIHDQSVRRREPGSLRKRFLHDYVVFELFFYFSFLVAFFFKKMVKKEMGEES